MKIANIFNEFFINIGDHLSKDINSNTDPLNYVKGCQNSIYIPEFTELEVINTIISLKTVVLDMMACLQKSQMNIYTYILLH